MKNILGNVSGIKDGNGFFFRTDDYELEEEVLVSSTAIDEEVTLN